MSRRIPYEGLKFHWRALIADAISPAKLNAEAIIHVSSLRDSATLKRICRYMLILIQGCKVTIDYHSRFHFGQPAVLSYTNLWLGSVWGQAFMRYDTFYRLRGTERPFKRCHKTTKVRLVTTEKVQPGNSKRRSTFHRHNCDSSVCGERRETSGSNGAHHE